MAYDLFDAPHSTVLVSTFMVLAFLMFKSTVIPWKYRNAICKILGVVLMVNELSTHARLAIIGEWKLTRYLPLHLCDFGVWCAIVVLLTNGVGRIRKFALEFLLLVGAGGAIQGLFTPVLPLWFPNLPFFFFAICHAGTFLSPYFVLAVHPELCPRNFIYGYFRQMGTANVILLFVSCINWLIGSNYMYSCRKPDGASLFDVLGPWPWYVFVAELLLGPNALGLWVAALIQCWFAAKVEKPKKQ